MARSSQTKESIGVVLVMDGNIPTQFDHMINVTEMTWKGPCRTHCSLWCMVYNSTVIKIREYFLQALTLTETQYTSIMAHTLNVGSTKCGNMGECS